MKRWPEMLGWTLLLALLVQGLVLAHALHQPATPLVWVVAGFLLVAALFRFVVPTFLASTFLLCTALTIWTALIFSAHDAPGLFTADLAVAGLVCAALLRHRMAHDLRPAHPVAATAPRTVDPV